MTRNDPTAFIWKRSFVRFLISLMCPWDALLIWLRLFKIVSPANPRPTKWWYLYGYNSFPLTQVLFPHQTGTEPSLQDDDAPHHLFMKRFLKRLSLWFFQKHLWTQMSGQLWKVRKIIWMSKCRLWVFLQWRVKLKQTLVRPIWKLELGNPIFISRLVIASWGVDISFGSSTLNWSVNSCRDNVRWNH